MTIPPFEHEAREGGQALALGTATSRTTILVLTVLEILLTYELKVYDQAVGLQQDRPSYGSSIIYR